MDERRAAVFGGPREREAFVGRDPRGANTTEKAARPEAEREEQD